MFQILQGIERVIGHLCCGVGLILLSMLLPNSGQAHTFEGEVECLARNIYHEARGEPVAGQIAVGIVTLNRVESRRYPNDVCSVVHQRKQFSWTRLPEHVLTITNPRAWRQAQTVAKRVIAGDYDDATYQLDGVMHYHNHTVRPRWAAAGELVVAIGRHRFYLL